MGIENIKYCRKCKEAFDIGTDSDLCPKCRNKTKEVKDGITRII